MKTRDGSTPKFAGAAWVWKAQKKEMSHFGIEVANLIGQLTCGIYHVSDETRKMDWGSDHYIEWRTRWPLATTDNDGLTELVLLAHDRCIRVEIAGCSQWTVKVIFTPRKRGDASSCLNHPDIEPHVQEIRRRH